MPEEFFILLDQVQQPVTEEKTVRGYKVKVKYAPAAGEGEKAKMKAISEVVAKAVKRMRE